MLNVTTGIIRSYVRHTPDEDAAFMQYYDGFFKEISIALVAYFKDLTNNNVVIEAKDDSLLIEIPRIENTIISMDDNVGDDVFESISMYFLHETLRGLSQFQEEKRPQLVSLEADIERIYQHTFADPSKYHYCASLVFGALIGVLSSFNDETFDKVESPFSPLHKKKVHDRIDKLLHGYEYTADSASYKGMLTYKIKNDVVGSRRIDQFFGAEV